MSSDFDEEFQTLFNEISADCSVDEYLDADNSTATCEEVDANKVVWRETLRQECADEVVNGKEQTIDSDCMFLSWYAFQSESTLYSCLNVKELLARSRREI